MGWVEVIFFLVFHFCGSDSRYDKNFQQLHFGVGATRSTPAILEPAQSVYGGAGGVYQRDCWVPAGLVRVRHDLYNGIVDRFHWMANVFSKLKNHGIRGRIMEIRLLSREMFFRWGSSLLILVALVAAATMMMAAPTTLSDYNRQASLQLDQRQQELDKQLTQIQNETDVQLKKIQDASDKRLAELDKKTKRVMRDLGFNLRIVHRDTALTGLLADYESLPIPEEYVTRLAESPEITKMSISWRRLSAWFALMTNQG